MTPPSAAPPAAPAISDADLARLLGLAGGVPAAPADLVDRILARMPLDPVVGAAVTPTLRPSRRRRWLRIGIGTGASLLIGTAVAASFARIPALAPYLQPLLARVATMAGAPPPPVPPPTRAAAARPTSTTAAPATPVRIDARLPAPTPANMPIVAAPILPPAAAVPPATEPVTSIRTPTRRTVAAAVVAARIAEDRALPAAVLRRQAARANSADLSVAPMALPDAPGNPGSPGNPGMGIAPERPGLAARAATIIERRAAAPPADTPPAADAAPPTDAAIGDPAPDRPAAALPATAAERAAAIAELRAARAAGTLTTAQAQRLRALQQLRAARSARAAARRPGN